MTKEKKISYNNQTKTLKNIKVAAIILISIIVFILLGMLTPIIELGLEEGIIIIIASILLFALYLSSLNSNLFKLKFQYVQSYFDELKTNTPDLVYIKNLKSEIIDCNKAFLKFFDLKQEEVYGNNFFYLFKEDEQKEISKFEKILKSELDFTKIQVGDFVEVDGELQKNPLINYMDIFVDILILIVLRLSVVLFEGMVIDNLDEY